MMIKSQLLRPLFLGILACTGFVMVSVASNAQEALEEIVVTASVRGDDHDIPGVSLKIRADFIIQEIVIESDSREKEMREKEIRDTLAKLIKHLSKSSNYTIVEVRDNLVIPIDPKEPNVEISSGHNRPDISKLYVSIKRPLNPATLDGTEVIREIDKILLKVKGSGRATLEREGSSELSILQPSQYRTKLLTSITDEINLIIKNLGGNYSAVINGLDKPVMWQRSGLTNMQLFIPYTVQILPENFNGTISLTYE